MDPRNPFYARIALSLLFWTISPAQAQTQECLHGGARIQTLATRPAEIAPPRLFPASGYPELQVRVLETWNYRAEQLRRLERMAELMKHALNSEALRDYILQHTFRGRRTFSDNKGLTNEQIYDRIREAHEEGFSNERYVAEFRSQLYSSRRNVVGYVTPARPSWIMTNTKYFNPWSDADVAAHLAHEWLHLIGFSHYQSHQGSVPYDVGDEVARIALAAAQNGL